jgi:hypothetical protein
MQPSASKPRRSAAAARPELNTARHVSASHVPVPGTGTCRFWTSRSLRPRPSAGFDEAAEALYLARPRVAELAEDGSRIDEPEHVRDAHSGRVTTPSPVLRAIGETRCDWVPRDVSEGLEQRLRRLLSSRPVPIADEVPGPAVPGVEAPRIGTDKPMHAPGQRAVGHFDDRVPVRRKQADGKAPPPVSRGRRHEEPQPDRAVEIVREVEGRPRRAHADVLETRCKVTRGTGHELRLGQRRLRRKMASWATCPLGAWPGAWHLDVALWAMWAAGAPD